MKLGDWQKLWVLLSVLWLVIVGFFAVSAMPTVEQYEGRRCVSTAYAVEAFQRRQRQEVYKPLKAEDLRSRVDCSKVLGGNTEERTLAVSKTEELQTNYKDKIDFSQVEATYKRRMEQLWPKRIKIGFVALLLWGVPMGLIYLFGAAVGWVIRGFKGGHP